MKRYLITALLATLMICISACGTTTTSETPAPTPTSTLPAPSLTLHSVKFGETLQVYVIQVDDGDGSPEILVESDWECGRGLIHMTCPDGHYDSWHETDKAIDWSEPYALQENFEPYMYSLSWEVVEGQVVFHYSYLLVE